MCGAATLKTKLGGAALSGGVRYSTEERRGWDDGQGCKGRGIHVGRASVSASVLQFFSIGNLMCRTVDCVGVR